MGPENSLRFDHSNFLRAQRDVPLSALEFSSSCAFELCMPNCNAILCTARHQFLKAESSEYVCILHFQPVDPVTSSICHPSGREGKTMTTSRSAGTLGGATFLATHRVHSLAPARRPLFWSHTAARVPDWATHLLHASGQLGHGGVDVPQQRVGRHIVHPFLTRPRAGPSPVEIIPWRRWRGSWGALTRHFGP